MHLHEDVHEPFTDDAGVVALAGEVVAVSLVHQATNIELPVGTLDFVGPRRCSKENEFGWEHGLRFPP